MSSTVDKALDLLNQFTQARANVGLSELARLSGLDKATTHRMLVVLAKHGLVEQDAQSKLYRLGANTLRLARNREASFPMATLIEESLQTLAEKTGETAHASLLAGHAMATIGIVMSKKAIHVTLDAGERLPLHATASGIACLAFLPDEQAAVLLKRRLASYTDNTVTKREEVLRHISLAHAKGYATSDQTYESDVYGIAAPLFGAGGYAMGAVAVATPAHRMNRETKALVIRSVLDTSVNVTRRLGGEPPLHFHSLMRKAAA